MTPLRILLGDDHQVVRQGIRALLEQQGMQVVAECADGREAVQLAAKHTPDISILEISMRTLNGIDSARRILQQRPAAGVVILTFQTNESQVMAALCAGIRGYVLKTESSDDLVHAVCEVARRGTYFSPGISQIVVAAYLTGRERRGALTSREREVLQLVAEGNTTKKIADVLGLKVKTAEAYRGRLMEKLDIHETASLVRYAVRHGVIQAALLFCYVADWLSVNARDGIDAVTALIGP
jgi:DNA-binding NarL/FixJ family response regulator